MLDTKEKRRLNSLIFLFIVAIIAILLLSTEIVILINQSKLYNATIDALSTDLKLIQDQNSLLKYYAETEEEEEVDEEANDDTVSDDETTTDDETVSDEALTTEDAEVNNTTSDDETVTE